MMMTRMTTTRMTTMTSEYDVELHIQMCHFVINVNNKESHPDHFGEYLSFALSN